MLLWLYSLLQWPNLTVAAVDNMAKVNFLLIYQLLFLQSLIFLVYKISYIQKIKQYADVVQIQKMFKSGAGPIEDIKNLTPSSAVCSHILKWCLSENSSSDLQPTFAQNVTCACTSKFRKSKWNMLFTRPITLDYWHVLNDSGISVCIMKTQSVRSWYVWFCS